MSILNKLCIGSAQFGLPYGANNKTGQVPIDEVKKILEYAEKNNINYIDTASGYGDAETILGNVGLDNFKVTTKLMPVPPTIKNIETWLLNELEKSLQKLQKEKIYGLLLHDTKILKSSEGEKVINSLQIAKKEKLINKVGISIYDPEELNLINNLNKIDIVQAPYNIFDRRLEITGWIDKLYSENIEIQARSIFLQGILLQKSHALDKRFQKWQSYFQNFEKFLDNNDLSAYEACVSFVEQSNKISQIVVGIDYFEQFKQLIRLALIKRQSNEMPNILCNDLDLIDPRRWPDR